MIDPNLIYPGSADAPQAMPGEEMDMPKRPNVRRPRNQQGDEALTEWGKHMVSKEIDDAIKEQTAADRLLEQERYPYNNFALSALILAGLIILIGLAYVTGMVK